ncbi:MAG TPA: group III truncated hemoglobin [Saprospiraceae bacterium]|nr:group III truncated hemoglobin [Saprospiraceae bacterium]HPN70668.1 group III truncated hemoglobin [Saprospiraceae bacterium]
MHKDISNVDDIKLMVDSFYERIRQDDLIGHIFNRIIGDKWPEHLEKMYRFWQTILLEDHTYFGSPFLPHAHLPVEREHFDRWVSLFNANMDDLFVGPKADEARWRAEKMAAMFLVKIRYIKNEGLKPLI